jgi:uncharacterized protein
LFAYDFQLTSGDMNTGTVYLPSKESKNIPTIIYCHGWSGSRQLWLPTEKLCEKALLSNIALITFDFFGCGETGGDYTLMTFERWKNNLSDIFSWCTSQPFADVHKIGCYSFSAGSTAALRLAQEDDRIAFIVSVGTCISSHINMVGGGPSKIFADNYKEILSGGKKEIFGVKFGAEFFVDAISNAPIHKMKKIKCPSLFLQGTADNPFRCADAKMAYQIMKNEGLSADYVELKNGNHELDNVIDDALYHMFNWLSSIV